MGKLIFLHLSFMFGVAHVFAHSKNDTIEIKKKGIMYHYKMDGKELEHKELSVFIPVWY